MRNDVLEINYNSNGLFQISIRSKLLALLFHPQFTLDLSVIFGTPHLVHLYIFFVRPMGGSNNKELEIDCLRFPSLYLKAIIIGEKLISTFLKTGGLSKDLREYLTTRFAKGSVDHELQTTIRDNLYLRTVPVTTRPARPGETDGLDYTFLNLDQFRQLEKSGSLLERGIYDGKF